MKQEYWKSSDQSSFLRSPRRRWAGTFCAGLLLVGAGGWAAVGVTQELGTPKVEKTETPAPPVKVDPAQLSRAQAPALTSFAPIVEKVAPSVVTVYTTKTVRQDLRTMPGMDNDLLRRFFGGGGDAAPGQGGQPAVPEKSQALGSGVIVSPDGQILTNNHVVEGADEILVRLGNSDHEYKATKIGTDPGTDLAVLKINAKNLPAVTFADSDKARIGDMVLAIGNPFGLGQTVTSGIVSALGRTGMGIVDYENFIQTDASINPGNSGGALIDAEGRVLGINTAIYSRSGGNMGIGFAVPSNLARQVFQSIHEKGRMIRGYLGVLPQALTDDLASMKALKLPESTSGALIAEVVSGGPADKAGVHAGDVVTAIDGKKVADDRQFRLSISGTSPGSKVSLKLWRDGKEQDIPVQLAELPARNRVARNGGSSGGDEPQSVGKSNILDGITVGSIDDNMRRDAKLPAKIQGAAITAIEPNCAGYEAGLRQGDIVTEMNREPVKDADEAVTLSDKVEKEDSVLLRIYSKGASRYVALSPKAP